jgi:transposase
MANRRFEMYQYRQVLVRMRLGDTDRAIARSGLVGRRKAGELRRCAEQEGWLDPSRPLPEDAQLSCKLGRGAVKASCISLVEPFREEVSGWHARGIQGSTIYQALVRTHGFRGSYSSVRRFLQGLDEAHPQATVILDFAPGEAAQVDFGSGPRVVDRRTGEEVSTWFFVMTLAFSRHQYAELVTDQKVATWLACHRRAFEWFGGCPAKLIIDNPKCAITRACVRDPEVQRAYGECAEGYGFKLDPCPPRDPKKKGRVESGVKYVKRNFLPLREFRDLADANRQLRAWVLGEAGNRVHGTTRERPLSLFRAAEQALLRALPDVPPVLATWAKVKVHGNAHVQFEQALYSVPFRLVRQTLWLKASDTTVQVFRDHLLVATHPRLTRAGERSTVQDHLPPEALAYALADPQWCLTQAERIGPACRALIERLFAHRVLDNLRAAQGVIRLGKRFGTLRLEAACQRALGFDSPRYRTVKTILEKGLDQAGAEAAFDTLAESYTGAGRFCRDTARLLTH